MRSPYDPQNISTEKTHENAKPRSKDARGLIMVTLGITTLSIFWRYLAGSEFRGTALLYIGIPMVLAFVLSMAPTPGSATGKAMHGMTLALLLIGILFIEGFICILIASPIFYLVALIIGLSIDAYHRRKNKDARLQCSVVGILILFSLEGITESLSFNRIEKISAYRETNLTLEQARERLTNGPSFDLKTLPLFLKAGFPTPQAITGYGSTLGDQWTIHFQGESGLDPLVVEITEASPKRLVFRCLKNESKISEWMRIDRVEWTLHARDNSTRIEMTMHYERLLDPAWYFKPIQRYGAQKAVEYFLAAIFTSEQ